MTHRRVAGLCAGILGLTGGSVLACDGVPPVFFGGDDGAAPADAETDAATPDTGAPGNAGAAADATCPEHPPPGATACCGPVPCSGNCDAWCNDCLAKCAATGSICCAGNNAVCHATGFICR